MEQQNTRTATIRAKGAHPGPKCLFKRNQRNGIARGLRPRFLSAGGLDAARPAGHHLCGQLGTWGNRWQWIDLNLQLENHRHVVAGILSRGLRIVLRRCGRDGAGEGDCTLRGLDRWNVGLDLGGLGQCFLTGVPWNTSVSRNYEKDSFLLLRNLQSIISNKRYADAYFCC